VERERKKKRGEGAREGETRRKEREREKVSSFVFALPPFSLLTEKLTLDPALSSTNNDRLQELIRHVLLVVGLNARNRIHALLSDSANETVHSELNPLPPLVSIHSVVSSDDGSDLSESVLGESDEVEELLHVASSRTRSGISTVSEEVDVDFGDTDLLGCLEESFEMVDVGVDSSVGDLGGGRKWNKKRG